MIARSSYAIALMQESSESAKLEACKQAVSHATSSLDAARSVVNDARCKYERAYETLNSKLSTIRTAEDQHDLKFYELATCIVNGQLDDFRYSSASESAEMAKNNITLLEEKIRSLEQDSADEIVRDRTASPSVSQYQAEIRSLTEQLAEKVQQAEQDRVKLKIAEMDYMDAKHEGDRKFWQSRERSLQFNLGVAAALCLSVLVIVISVSGFWPSMSELATVLVTSGIAALISVVTVLVLTRVVNNAWPERFWIALWNRLRILGRKARNGFRARANR